MGRFLDALGLTRYALYVFDYGAPVGFRLALAHPERVAAIVSQNGNAYEARFERALGPHPCLLEGRHDENRNNLRAFLQAGTTQFQYQQGEPNPTRIAPDGLHARPALPRTVPATMRSSSTCSAITRPTSPTTPNFRKYFRTHKPAFLAVWGKNDPFFLPAGAEAFRRDLPDAEVHLIDGGHFALEAHLDEVAGILAPFLARTLDVSQGKALFGELNMDSVPAEGRQLVAAMSGAFGFVPNLGYALGAEPAVLEVYMKMLGALGETVLDSIAQQVALGAASHTNGAEYAVCGARDACQEAGCPRRRRANASQRRQLPRSQA